MTLRLEQVVPDIRAVITGYLRQAEMAATGLDAAGAALDSWAASPDAADRRILDQMTGDPRPFALSCDEPLNAARPAPAFRPVTVVAADGSSISPDRFAPVPCFVVNVGYVSLPYGTAGRAFLGAEAITGPKSLIVAAEDDGSDTVDARGLGVELQRDVAELERGHDLAADAAAAGDTVLLLDGTLLPWDLDARHIAEAVRVDALDRTNASLNRLRELGPAVSLGAYVSATRAAEVVTSLQALAGTPSLPRADAPLFRRLLGDGERSALFRSQSRRGERVEKLLAAHAAVFFYLRVGDDLARVELPQWAASKAQVERLHATIVDQCRRCEGYPRALQEAHEQAVINGADRQAFSRLLERESSARGLFGPAAGKAASKRRRAV
jgi:hypothetical protein